MSNNVNNTNHKGTCSQLKSGFTLIELLVVVAIVSILAGFLLPALQKAISNARSIQCLASTKQIGTAILMYADDYSTYLPQSDKIDRNEDLAMSRESTDNCLIWTCPEADLSLPYLDKDISPVTYTTSKSGLPWVNACGSGKKYTQIRRPTTALILADGSMNTQWGSWITIDGTGDMWGYNDYWQDCTWFNNNRNLDDPVYVSAADEDKNGATSGIRYRHNMNSNTNALFFDGHSASFKRYGIKRVNFITCW
ncbi:MAG: type II secretion system protein [Planctomycetes bacterium]|nr:type II secretion system protein [Planctomycetota bacterium]